MAAMTLDSIDIANILAQELFYQQLVSSLDGLHSGVPTRTTPTLTPTTLRTIEQTFLDFTNESASHSREAGFVPPLIEPSQPTPAQTQNSAIIHHQQQQEQQQHVLLEVQQQHQHQQQQQQQHLQQQLQQQQLSLSEDEVQPQQQTRRNMGGRRPTRTAGISPEEEERRQVRRERNKMAAARCRKRRMDHTNALLEETEGLEQKKQSLQDEISQLQSAKEELEFMLEAHRAVCRLQSSSPPDIKPVIPNTTTSAAREKNTEDLHNEEFSELPCGKAIESNNHRPNRPDSLPVGFNFEPKPRPSSLQFKQVETPAFMKPCNDIVAGVPITTPSTGIAFNFDSLMEGGTGLTPVSTPLIPSCSSQQRNNHISHNVHNHHHHLSAVDLSSPDANPPKLVSL